jgi:transglutaminase-like putative cysteine protease
MNRDPNLSSDEEAQAAPPGLGRVRAGPPLAAALYLLLVGSAALAMWVKGVPGALPRQLELAAPWVFLTFAVCFAVYRLVLVRAGRYPVFKAFFQIGAALLFFTLLLPQARLRYDPSGDPLEALLADRDPRVRSLAAEVARHRPDPGRYASELAEALRDPDERVRTQAHRSLVEITGTDLGSPEDDAAVRAWQERYP